MILSVETREKLRALPTVLTAVPDETFVYINDGTVQFCASNQTELRHIRGFFRGCFWKKRWEKYSNCWFYTTTISGVDVIITCQEKPPTCEKVVTKRIERKRVPTAFEEQDVEVEEVSWNCGKDDDPAVGDAEAIANASGADNDQNIPF